MEGTWSLSDCGVETPARPGLLAFLCAVMRQRKKLLSCWSRCVLGTSALTHVYLPFVAFGDGCESRNCTQTI